MLENFAVILNLIFKTEWLHIIWFLDSDALQILTAGFARLESIFSSNSSPLNRAQFCQKRSVMKNRFASFLLFEAITR